MAEYTNMIVVSSILTTLFLGGWTLGGLEKIPFLSIVFYGIKVGIFLFIFIWLRATLPRVRYDQLMRFGWQVLLPLAVLNLLVTATAIVLDWPWWSTGIFGLAVLVIVGSIFALRVKTREPQQVVDVGVTFPNSVRLIHMEADTPTTSVVR